MATRAVFLDGVVLPLWAFNCFMNLGVFGFDILLSSLGVVSGLVFGVAVALRFIKSLERKGEFRATLKGLALALLTIVILVPIALYLLFSFGLEAVIQMGHFLYPFVLAFYAIRIAFYLRWERKHKKHILFDGLVLTRVYAAPRDLKSRVG